MVKVAIGIDGLGDLITHDRATDRHIARRQALGDCHDMWADANGFGPEPVTGPTKATDHLVRDQQDVILVANPLDFRPIGRRRHDDPACALNRLTDKGRDIFFAQLKNSRFKLLRAGQTEVLRRHITAFGPPVGLVDVVDTLNNAALCMHSAHTAKAHPGHCRSVIGIAAADHDLFVGLALTLPITANKAQVCIIRLRPRPREEYVVQIARRQFRQFGGQCDHRDMGRLKERIIIRQFAHLAGSNIGKAIAAISDIHTP